ncbi:MAG: hypothetical protein AAF490_17650 [Chloroflexota bacterium]
MLFSLGFSADFSGLLVSDVDESDLPLSLLSVDLDEDTDDDLLLLPDLLSLM